MGCVLYYWLWVWAIPRIRGYRIRQEVLSFGAGAQSHRLTKVPVGELDIWDRTHDAVGRIVGVSPVGTDDGQESEVKGAREVVTAEKSAA